MRNPHISKTYQLSSSLIHRIPNCLGEASHAQDKNIRDSGSPYRIPLLGVKGVPTSPFQITCKEGVYIQLNMTWMRAREANINQNILYKSPVQPFVGFF